MKIQLIIALLISTLTIYAVNIDFIEGGVISAPITLNVPEDYPTIQDALTAIEDKKIDSHSVVTISVADGNYTDYDTVFIDHPDGNKIEIIGNESDPNNVTIQFKSGVNGFWVNCGKSLSLLNGFKILGDQGASTGNGLLSTNNSSLITGSSMIVKSFKVGVNAVIDAHIVCNGITVEGCYDGISITRGSYVESLYSKIINNSGNGIVLSISSSIFFTGSESSGNAIDGILIDTGSLVRADGCNVSNNSDHGIDARFGSNFVSQGQAPILNNNVNGNSTYSNSFIVF